MFFIFRILFHVVFACTAHRPFPDGMGQPEVHQRPQHHIEQKDEVDVNQGSQPQVEQGKKGGNEENGDHGRAVAHAQGQELVVNVGLVGHEGILMAPDAAEHHAYHIETRHHKQRKDHHQRIEGESADAAVVHAETDGQQTENQTDGLAAAIAHKDFTPHLGAPEHVVDEEGHEGAERGKREDGIGPVAAKTVEAAQKEQGYHGEAGGQTVDAVNQVDGVDDKHQQHGGKGHAHPGRKLVHAEKAVQVVEPYAGTDNHDGADELGEELGLVAHADEVVGHAFHIEDDQRREAEGQMGAVGHVGHAGAGRGDECEQTYHQGQRNGDDGGKGHAPQTGHNAFVDLAFVGKVKKFLLVGYQDDFRNHKSRKHGTH